MVFKQTALKELCLQSNNLLSPNETNENEKIQMRKSKVCISLLIIL